MTKNNRDCDIALGSWGRMSRQQPEVHQSWGPKGQTSNQWAQANFIICVELQSGNASDSGQLSCGEAYRHSLSLHIRSTRVNWSKKGHIHGSSSNGNNYLRTSLKFASLPSTCLTRASMSLRALTIAPGTWSKGRVFSVPPTYYQA